VEDLEIGKNTHPNLSTYGRFEDNNTHYRLNLSGQVNLIATGNLVATGNRKRQPQRAPESKFMLKIRACYIGMAKGEVRYRPKSERANQAGAWRRVN